MPDPIRHRPDCPRHVGPTGVGFTCDCAMQQTLPEVAPAPEPNERERAHARELVAEVFAPRTERERELLEADVGKAFARYRVALLRSIREILDADDAGGPAALLERIREVVGG